MHAIDIVCFKTKYSWFSVKRKEMGSSGVSTPKPVNWPSNTNKDTTDKKSPPSLKRAMAGEGGAGGDRTLVQIRNTKRLLHVYLLINFRV